MTCSFLNHAEQSLKKIGILSRSTIIHLFSLVISLIILCPASGTAHSLFIQSGRHHLSEGKASPLFFCYGHHFPVDDAVRRKKLAYVHVIAPDKTVNNVTLRDDRSLHSYLVSYDKPGTYVLAAETTTGYFAMYIDKKGRKRHSFKPLYEFAEKADKILSSMKSSQWAKTYVFCEEPSKNFPANIGLPLEIVPGKDLASVKAGDSVAMTVFRDGKAYMGEGFWDATYSGFSTESEDMYIQKTKCINGQFVLPVDVSGRWFVRFFTKNPAPEASVKKFLTEKRTTTLVFQVRNERKRPKIDSH